MNKESFKRAIEYIEAQSIKSEKTKKLYRDILQKIFTKEEELRKPYVEFTYHEAIDMLKFWKIKTLRSLNIINTILNKYIEFYVNEGMANPKEVIFLSEEDLKLCIYSDYDNKYFTSVEEYEYFVENFCHNAQDAVVYTLRFEGVGGRQHEEIRNLREEDCNTETNELTLRSTDKDGNEQVRTIKISNVSMRVIQDAINETSYFKNNGLENPDNKTQKFTVSRNGYVVRYSGRESYEPVKFYLINDRVKKLSRAYGKELLNPKNVFYSGMVLRLKELEDNKGELTTQDYKAIHKRYGLSENTWFYSKQLYQNIKQYLS
ncbi:hypothetical protein CCE28_00120 [Anaeromicrobium sediminis]|uniref:Core-binding (CB) domain-containing protein n=2 Tax=Anaeromicrobium sediminis TaxID=1478221 RepID=A0A267MMP7_9FIRM|nr:hypothetical protein CCE28_00120 [Anaeromicrobium sediminis]